VSTHGGGVGRAAAEDPGAELREMRETHNRSLRLVPASQAIPQSLVEPLLPWLVLAWGAGVLVLSVRMLGAWVWIQWLVRCETKRVPEELGQTLCRLKSRMEIVRAVRLLESVRLQSPLAVGWLRPVILLPVTAVTGLPSDQLEAILAHELAHIKRY